MRRPRAVKALVPSSRTHPWKVRTGHGTNVAERVFKTLRDARQAITEDLAYITKRYQVLRDDEVVERVATMHSAALLLQPGGVVEGVLDSDRNIRYRAELVTRRQPS